MVRADSEVGPYMIYQTPLVIRRVSRIHAASLMETGVSIRPLVEVVFLLGLHIVQTVVLTASTFGKLDVVQLCETQEVSLLHTLGDWSLGAISHHWLSQNHSQIQ